MIDLLKSSKNWIIEEMILKTIKKYNTKGNVLILDNKSS